jgi:hypothetical protein
MQVYAHFEVDGPPPVTDDLRELAAAEDSVMVADLE